MPRAVTAWLTTTGKSAEGENFPVASLLLAPAVRPQVMAFYRFARYADDIADTPLLTPESKLEQLNALDLALAGRPAGPGGELAYALRRAVSDDPRLLSCAAQLLHAFRRDALCSHCRDWSDLMAYCRCSAVPVGRFLLALHGEAEDCFAASDALCSAHQILNHVQDCAADYQCLGRVYLPRSWMQCEGADCRALAAGEAGPELRSVLDLVLDGADGLIEMARPLPRQLRSRRLALQAAVTLAAAERLSRALRRDDPLAARLRLTRRDWVISVAVGGAKALRFGS